MCIAIFINAQTKVDTIPPIDYSEHFKNINNEILEIKKQLDGYILSTQENLNKLKDHSIDISSKSSIKDLKKLKSEITNKINILEKKLEESNIIITTDIDNVNSSLNVTNNQLDSANNKLTSQEEKITESQLSNDKTSMISLISLILGGLLIIALIIIYKLASKNKTNISSTKDDIKDILKLDNELKNILEKHTQLLEQNKGGNSEEETLKSLKIVVDEITTMENNIYQMTEEEKNSRGLKRIMRAIKNVRNNYQTMGYDIPVLLGTEWKEGDIMEIIAELPDDSIEKGKKIITRVVTPRIDFNKEMVQRPKVELKSNI